MHIQYARPPGSHLVPRTLARHAGAGLRRSRRQSTLLEHGEARMHAGDHLAQAHARRRRLRRRMELGR